MSPNHARLQALVDEPAARAFFKGLFARAHLELSDSGERFTVTQSDDAVRVSEGFDGEAPNLVVSLAGQNLVNLNNYITNAYPVRRAIESFLQQIRNKY